jgi:large subunit ribosomal protein L30e
MAKKKISKELMDLKQEVTSGKAVIGTKSVLKNLKESKLIKIYLATNCPSDVRKDIEHYSALVKTPIVTLEIDNEEVGVLCKKYFFISVLGIKKE